MELIGCASLEVVSLLSDLLPVMAFHDVQLVVLVINVSHGGCEAIHLVRLVDDFFIFLGEIVDGLSLDELLRTNLLGGALQLLMFACHRLNGQTNGARVLELEVGVLRLLRLAVVRLAGRRRLFLVKLVLMDLGLQGQSRSSALCLLRPLILCLIVVNQGRAWPQIQAVAVRHYIQAASERPAEESILVSGFPVFKIQSEFVLTEAIEVVQVEEFAPPFGSLVAAGMRFVVRVDLEVVFVSLVERHQLSVDKPPDVGWLSGLLGDLRHEVVIVDFVVALGCWRRGLRRT